MKKIHIARIAIFTTTIVVVVTMATILGLYARGYRFSREDGLSPHGLLAIKSEPSGAQVFVNEEIKTATDDNLSLEPGLYDVEVRKEGYRTWQKELKIEEEAVTQVIAQLFKSAPSLNAITFTGATRPVPSRDLSKIAYVVPPETPAIPDDQSGLWVLETVNLPIGFSRVPRRITDIDLSEATITWSPDDREILVQTINGSYLLDANDFVEQGALVNLGSAQLTTFEVWDEELDKRKDDQLDTLPEELSELIKSSDSAFAISPDNDMVLYTANTVSTITKELISPVVGASNQEQDRDIKVGHTYVYDIEEDRNFLIDTGEKPVTISTGSTISEDIIKRISWFPTSRNLVIADEGSVSIIDYDGTNKQDIFTGNYTNPFAFPTVSDDRILLLTNFGAEDTLPNLYSVNLK